MHQEPDIELKRLKALRTALEVYRKKLMGICMLQMKIATKHSRKLGKVAEQEYNQILDIYNSLKRSECDK